MIKQLKNYVLLGSLFLSIISPLKSKADDFLKGIKGPTNFQVDERVQYSKNDKNIKALTNNLILKYWDGDDLGLFGFANIPYKQINDNSGIGDFTIGLGPRAKVNDLHFLSYISLTFPTGDFNKNLGNGRYDKKFGLFTTYLNKNSGYDINNVAEYNLTGKNEKGITPPNELYLSLFSGKEISDKLRIGLGLTDLIKENDDYDLRFRTSARYTVSKFLHFELIGELPVSTKNMPKSKGVGIFMRYNF